jgi:hypothetical protein
VYFGKSGLDLTEEGGATVILGLTEGDFGLTEGGLTEGDFGLIEGGGEGGLTEGDFGLTEGDGEGGLTEGDFGLTEGVLDRLTDAGGVLLGGASSSSSARIDDEIGLTEGGRDGVLDLLTDAGGVLLLFFGLGFFTVFLTTISSPESSEVEPNSFDLYFGGLTERDRDRLGEGDRDFCF